MSKAEYSALAVAVFFAGIIVWLLSRVKGKAQLVLAKAPSGGIAESTFEGQDTLAAVDADVMAWAQATGLDPSWLAQHIGDAEQAAYDAGAPTDWAARGWPSPLGPWTYPLQYFPGMGAVEAMA